jgi:hypothetical protein
MQEQVRGGCFSSSYARWFSVGSLSKNKEKRSSEKLKVADNIENGKRESQSHLNL